MQLQSPRKSNFFTYYYMSKTILSSLGCAIMLVSSSSAAITGVNLSGSPTTGSVFVTDATTTSILADGSLVRIGTFESAPAANSTFESLASAFREFSRTTLGITRNPQVPDPAQDGRGRMNRPGLVGIDGGTSPDADSFFSGKTVYIWVYNSANADPLAAQGIFMSNQAASAFPAESLPTSTSFSINQFRTAIGTHNPAANPASVDLNANNTVTFFHLSAPIPEPSSVLTLSFVTVLGLLRRRR
jgi:hypothetical protein